MAVAVCRGAAVMPTSDVAPTWCAKDDDHQHRPAQLLDIWNIAIQPADNEKSPAAKNPYVHPLERRRSMSHKSLEVCTENLGCETGSGDFLSISLLDDTMGMGMGMGMPWLCAPSPAQPKAEEESMFQPPAMALDLEADKFGDDDKQEQQTGEGRISKDELTAVYYHCSRPQRAFPPPLPSMSRRDGPCLQMRPHRRDGRLVVQAVPARHQGYLHAQRQGGRLRLCFVDCSLRAQSTTTSNTVVQAADQEERVETEQRDQHDDEEEEEIVDEEHEEVEVVDRGTVVEVTVSSTQPQVATAAGKLHRSRLVINKFVGGTPLSEDHQPAPERCVSSEEPAAPAPGLRRVPSSTTTLAAAVAVASTTAAGEASGIDEEECGEHAPLLFTSRVGDTQELLQSVRRCRQLRQKPLFIQEPYCIATST